MVVHASAVQYGFEIPFRYSSTCVKTKILCFQIKKDFKNRSVFLFYSQILPDIRCHVRVCVSENQFFKLVFGLVFESYR